MTSDAFGYMNYDPNVAAYPSDEKVYYQITPIDIQICYKKLFVVLWIIFRKKR